MHLLCDNLKSSLCKNYHGAHVRSYGYYHINTQLILDKQEKKSEKQAQTLLNCNHQQILLIAQ
jgi:hypothetical protein